MNKKLKRRIALAVCVTIAVASGLPAAYYGFFALITSAGLTDTSPQENWTWCKQCAPIAIMAAVPFIEAVLWFRYLTRDDEPPIRGHDHRSGS